MQGSGGSIEQTCYKITKVLNENIFMVIGKEEIKNQQSSTLLENYVKS